MGLCEASYNMNYFLLKVSTPKFHCICVLKCIIFYRKSKVESAVHILINNSSRSIKCGSHIRHAYIDPHINSLTSIVFTSIYLNFETFIPYCVEVFRIQFEESCFKCPSEVIVLNGVCVIISSKFLKVDIK